MPLLIDHNKIEPKKYIIIGNKIYEDNLTQTNNNNDNIYKS